MKGRREGERECLSEEVHGSAFEEDMATTKKGISLACMGVGRRGGRAATLAPAVEGREAQTGETGLHVILHMEPVGSRFVGKGQLHRTL